ncbi:MAG: hypothetical protein KBC73_12250 [Burkholderiaceae bacterium]|nr:hypothetical protein [Burkholderiaceae bacterium]
MSAAVLGACLAGLAASAQATDVGVSIEISQPGVYGRVDIGRFPQPQLVVAQPVIIQRAPRPVQPVYLWVPPGHQKNWRKHCQDYRACNVPVYFVRDDWYRGHVLADDRRGPPSRHDRGRDDDRGHDRGPDHGKGHGHGQGKGHGRD